MGPMTRHTDIRIRPATEEDIAACAICWGNRRDTYPSIYPLRLADPSITRDKRLGRNARDLSDMLKDPHNMIHVACMHKTGESEPTKIVGYSIWARPEGLERDLSRWEKSKKAPSQDSQSDIQNDSDPECNHELAAKLKEESLLVKRKLFMGKRVWFLQQLFVSGDYQRIGIGTRLLERGLEMIEEVEAKEQEGGSIASEYEIALTSSPPGKVLYERYGFKDVYWFNPHFEDIDEKGNTIQRDIEWPLMVRQ